MAKELGLGIDNMLDDDELSTMLFSTDDEGNPQESEETDEDANEQNDDEEDNTTEVDPDELFDGEPESVGSEENNEGNREDTHKQKSGPSPDFFSSIATAFAEEGIFPDLDEETIKGIKDAESFRDAIKEQIDAGLDEQQKRVLECLDNNVEPDAIRQYEGTIGWLNAQDKNITIEGEEADNLRRNIILRDYINKGFNPERAQKKVEKIFEEGTEMEEAQEALQSLKQFYGDKYAQLRYAAQENAKKEAEERVKKTERIKKSIMDDGSKLLGDLSLSKDMKQKAFDAITKPVYKDPETGELYTAVQKLELDNSEDFMAKLGLIYAITNGFTSLNGIIDKKVKKETKKGFLDLEAKLSNTARDGYGNLNFASGVSDDNSFIGKGVKLDI